MQTDIALVHFRMVSIQRLLRNERIWSQRLIRNQILPLSSDSDEQKNEKCKQLISLCVPLMFSINDFEPLGCGTFGVVFRWKHKERCDDKWMDEVIKVPIYTIDT